MTKLFSVILNMSLTGSIVIGVVFLIRLLLRKAPKIYSYVLWSVVLFRLVCPVSVSLPLSAAAPFAHSATSDNRVISQMNYVRHDGDMLTDGAQATESHLIKPYPEETAIPQDGASESAAADTDSKTRRPVGSIILTVCSLIWLAGAFSAAGYSAAQNITLRQRLETACRIRGQIFESDEIETAFVFGVLKPRIYLPSGLPFDVQKVVIAHEQNHLRRHDHIIKFAAFVVSIVHWFNPLVWLAFKYMCVDMEKSCDEAALNIMDARGYNPDRVRYEYGRMLLALGSQRMSLLSVSFAESSLKERVRNVCDYKKISRRAAAALCAALALVCVFCAANPTAAHSLAPAERELLTIGDKQFYSDVTELELVDVNWTTDLSPLAKCGSLENLSLSCSSNGLDLSVLSECKNLKSIGLYGCNTDLSPLLKLEKLEALTLTYQEEYSSGPLPQQLSQFTKLRKLYCDPAYTDNITPYIGSLTGLESLGIAVRDQEDIDRIAELGALRELDISFGFDEPPTLDFSPFRSLTGLRSLRMNMEVFVFLEDMQESIYTDLLDSLSQCPLEELIINDEIGMVRLPEDEAFWSRFSSLRSFYANIQSRTGSIDFVKGMPHLEKLSLYTDAQLLDISAVSELRELKELSVDASTYCGAEQLRGSDLTGLCLGYSMESIDCDLSDIVSEMTELESLDIPGTVTIRSDALAGLTKLRYLEFESEDDCAAISGLTELEELHFSGTMTDLDLVSGMKKLHHLRAYSDNMTDVSAVTRLSELEFLNIASAALTEMPSLANCGKLTDIIIDCTPIDSLDFLEGLNEPYYVDLNLTNVPQELIDEFMLEHDCEIHVPYYEQ